MRGVTGFMLLVAMVAVQSALAAPPSFAAFPAAVESGSNAHAIDWSSDPDAKRFRTRLRQAFARGARFAGHYAVASWGCGSDCRVLAIIDLRTGRVSFGPGAEMDYEFHRNSRLLIANSPAAVQVSIRDFGGCPGKADAWAAISHYYAWTGTRFKHLRDVNACASAHASGK